MSFNRTFMELKVTKEWLPYEKSMFQSHLYGIESDIHATDAHATSRFNRTFMELKVDQCVRVLAILLVSIAPLWN